MSYLGLGLFAEGNTDYRFLRSVLKRATENLCLRQGRTMIDVGDVLEMPPPDRARNDALHRRIVEAVRDAIGGIHIVFLHTDGAGDPDGARTDRITPAVEAIEREFAAASPSVVAVVPVREMEAWALADGDALRDAFGVRHSNAVLGIPDAPHQVESIPDPKQALHQAAQTAHGGRRGHRRAVSAARYFGPIGESIALGQLRFVPSYAAFEAELLRALKRLNIVP